MKPRFDSFSDLFAVPELKPEDLFPAVNPNAFPKLDDETMRRVLELVRPIIDEYFRSAEQMAQRCFIVPMTREELEHAAMTQPSTESDFKW